MKKFLLRSIFYSIVFFIAFHLTNAAGGYVAIVIMAMVLAVLNTLLRPILKIIALPFDFFTFGIASLFVNMLTLFIAARITPTIQFGGFWIFVLVSICIMLADSMARTLARK